MAREHLGRLRKTVSLFSEEQTPTLKLTSKSGDQEQVKTSDVTSQGEHTGRTYVQDWVFFREFVK